MLFHLSSVSLATTAQLILAAQNTLFWSQRSSFPLEHSHCLRTMSSAIIRLEAKTKSHSGALSKEIFSTHYRPINLLDSFSKFKMNDGSGSQIVLCACGSGWWPPLACSDPSLIICGHLISFALNFPWKKVPLNICYVRIICPTSYEAWMVRGSVT